MQSFLPHQTFGGAAVRLTHSRSLARCLEAGLTFSAHDRINQFLTEKTTVEHRCENTSFGDQSDNPTPKYLRRSPVPRLHKLAAMAAPQKGHASLEKFLKSLKGRPLDASIESLIS